MGHRKYTDTCGVCGSGYISQEEPWAQYNWNIPKTSLCPECSQKIQWPNIPLYRVRMYDNDTGELIFDMVTIEEKWVTEEEMIENEYLKVTIIAPPMRFAR